MSSFNAWMPSKMATPRCPGGRRGQPLASLRIWREELKPGMVTSSLGEAGEGLVQQGHVQQLGDSKSMSPPPGCRARRDGWGEVIIQRDRVGVHTPVLQLLPPA